MPVVIKKRRRQYWRKPIINTRSGMSGVQIVGTLNIAGRGDRQVRGALLVQAHGEDCVLKFSDCAMLMLDRADAMALHCKLGELFRV